MSGIINQIGARSKIVSGKVGIGTAAPSKKLHVEGAVAGDYAALIKSTHATSGFGLQIQAGDSNSEKNLTLQDKDGSDTHLFYAGGNATFTGDLSMANGKGINFAAMTSPADAAGMTAEILDDYETGTWTATFVCGTSGSITIGAANTGFYTKVGRIVHVQGYFDVGAISSPVGDLSIVGLPFTTISGVGDEPEWSTTTIYISSAASALESVVGYISPGGTSIYIRENGLTTAGNDVSNHVDTGTTITISATFTV